jgi:glycosyltransferase involved in cell wall biosynthesis
MPSLISIVVPCFNEEEAFPHLRYALTDLVSRLGTRYAVEVVLVDDGSRDGTWALIERFAAEVPWVRGLTLSRNFGHQAALTCGYRHATGDAIVSLDADLQDPPAVIEEMVAKWEAGADVVYAVRRSRAGETKFKLATAAAFYRVLRGLGATHLRADAGDFRLLSRASLDALLALPETHRFLRGMVGWVGFRSVDVPYDRLARVAGETKYPFRKMLRLATDAVVSSSTLPLRFPYYFALAATALTLVAVGGAVAWGSPSLGPGGIALLIAVVAFGGLNLCALGVLGEYVGRVYEQVKDRPLYFVRSSVGSPGAASAPSYRRAILPLGAIRRA